MSQQPPVQLVTDETSPNYAAVKDTTGETTVGTHPDEELRDHSEVRDVRPSEVMAEVTKKDLAPGVPIDIEHKAGAYVNQAPEQGSADE